MLTQKYEDKGAVKINIDQKLFEPRQIKVKQKPIVLEVREKLGWSQRKLAAALGVKQPVFSDYELPQPYGTLMQPWRLKRLKAVCEENGLEVGWEELLRDHFLAEDKPKRKPIWKK